LDQTAISRSRSSSTPSLKSRRQERDANQGSIAKLNIKAMTDEQLARIKAGEHPYVVLAQTRAVLKDQLPQDGEILQIAPAQKDSSEA